MPGPAFCAASDVSTKIPVPMTAPIPSRVSWKAPSDRCRPFFSAVARMASSDFTRPNIMKESPDCEVRLCGRFVKRRSLMVNRGCAIPYRANPLSRQHRPEPAACKDMDMEVRHFLLGIEPGVGKQPVSRRNQPRGACNLAHRADEAGDLGVRPL